MFCCPRCSHLSTILNNIVEPESGLLFNIVDNCEQCGQQNIVQSCFHQYCNNLSVFTLHASIYYIFDFTASLINGIFSRIYKLLRFTNNPVNNDVNVLFVSFYVN
jgi:hypothetical protein